MSNYKLQGFLYGNLNPIQSLNMINKFSSKSLFQKNKLFSSATSGSKKTIKYFINLYSCLYNSFVRKIKNQDQEYFNLEKYLRSSQPLSNLYNSIEDLQIIVLVSLKKGSKIYYYYVSKSIVANNAVLMQVVVGYNIFKNYILTKILTWIISSEFFTEIRTEKQLGYLVETNEEDIFSHISRSSFYVISSNKNIKILTENILEFWNKLFSLNLTRITEKSFNIAKESILNSFKDSVKVAMKHFS